MRIFSSDRFKAVALGFAEARADRTLNVLFAAVAVLLALVWVLGKNLWRDPSRLESLPIVAVIVTTVALAFLVLGGLGWLLIRLAGVLMRWRAGEELREGMTNAQKAWVFLVVGFLAIPEFAHAFYWWHEHALQKIPGEEAAVNSVATFLATKREMLGGFGILALLPALVLWRFYGDFVTWLKWYANLAQSLVTGRGWKFVIAFALLTATVLYAVYTGYEAAKIAISLEMIAIVIWILLPIIRPNLRSELLVMAWIVPCMVVDARYGGLSFVATMIGWAAWNATFIGEFLLFPVYWGGVICFVAFLVW